jgi:hypothetical protein
MATKSAAKRWKARQRRLNDPTVFHPVAVPEQHQAMVGLRSSSAAQPHQDSRTTRERSRNDAERANIRRSLDGE